MPRTISAGVLAQLDASVVRPLYLIDIEFKDATLRLCSDTHDVTWNSLPWLGNGWFKGLSSIRETDDIEAPSIEVTLSGIPDTILSLVLNSTRQDKRGRFYLALRDSSFSIIDDPILLYDGAMDQPSILEAGESSTVAITFQSDLSRLRKGPSLTYSDSIQKSLYPSDRGFEFLNSLAEWSGYWGNKVKKLPKGEKEK